MNPIRVVHCKVDPFDVYIGRPSKWGNPFLLGRDGDRATVIAKFRHYLDACPELRAAAVKELSGKTLGCYCAPLPCHGDVLAEVIALDTIRNGTARQPETTE